jgi:hypothetical protein
VFDKIIFSRLGQDSDDRQPSEEGRLQGEPDHRGSSRHPPHPLPVRESDRGLLRLSPPLQAEEPGRALTVRATSQKTATTTTTTTAAAAKTGGQQQRTPGLHLVSQEGRKRISQPLVTAARPPTCSHTGQVCL